MSNITYSELYQRFGVRSTSGLTTPRLFNLENFILPRGAIVHYLPQSVSDLGPNDQFFPIINERLRPYIDQVTDMTAHEGAPRRRGAFNVENLKRQWLIRNRRYRRVTDIARALDDRQTAIVVNYSLIPMQWRYQPVPMARWFRFQNLMKTFASRVKYFGETSARPQFLFINLPDVLPSRQYLNVSVEAFNVIGDARTNMQSNVDSQTSGTVGSYYDNLYPGIMEGQGVQFSNEAFDESSLGWSEDLSFESFDDGSISMGDDIPVVSNEAMNRIRLGYFQDDVSLFLSDFWKWMSDNRAESILGEIPSSALKNLNLVIMRNGKFSMVSFDKLDLWVKSEENDKGVGFGSMSQTMNRYLQSIVTATSVSDKVTVEEEVDEEGNAEVVDVKVPEQQPGEPEVDVSVGDKGESDIARLRRSAQRVVRTPREILATKRNESTVQSSDVTATTTFQEEETAKVVTQPTPEKAPEEIIDTSDPLIKPVEERSRDLLSKGLISGNEFKRHVRLANSFKTIKAPFGEGTLEDFMKIPPETLWDFKAKEIPDIPHVVDKSMLKSTLLNYDSDYINKVFQKDVANMVINLQKAGLAITEYKVEKKSDALNDLYDYTIKVVPVYGSPSTIRFQLPAVDKNGKYRVNGTKYFMRKLKFDKPIRKISPSIVALSTYYGKLFVERSSRASEDLGSTLVDIITRASQMAEPLVTELVLGSTFAEDQDVPRTYSAIAKEFVSFILNGIQFMFDYSSLAKNFTEDVVKASAAKGWIPVGRKGKEFYFMNNEGALFTGDGKAVGSINAMLNVPDEKLPVEQVIVKIMGEEVPMAAILMYHMGITQLLNKLEVKPERRVKGTRVEHVPGTFEIVFADEIWRFPVHGGNSSLIWASLLRWKKYFRGFSVQELDNPDTYNMLFGMAGLTARYVREIDNLNALFLDPIAIDVLKEMNEPQELNDLFIKAAFYLVTDNYPSDIASGGSLIRGYERMPGAVYRALSGAVRIYSGQPVSSRATVDISPYEVLASIQKDPSVAIVEDSNPIHNLKEKENVTYAGTGGRSKRAMVRRTRAFHESDIGIRAEASVDNGDVGINTFLTANPNLTSLRGTAVPTVDPDPKKGVGNLLSTSALVAPFATYDDQYLF
ncbi:putative RNA polymerase beta subunit [Serratia phage vB_SmaS-Totoro]|nr:putative RNA polymerase beta subunit [Serratia phage vB_SmaS-Totoro]